MGEEATAHTLKTISIFGRLRQTRGVALYLLLVALGAGEIGLGLVGAIAETSGPQIGLELYPGLTVWSVDKRWVGIRRDDRVVALNGTPTRSDRDWADATANLKLGPATLQLERGGQRFEVTSEVLEIGDLLWWSIWLRFLVGVFAFIIGALTFALRPGVEPTWAFLIFTTGMGLNMLSLTVLPSHLAVVVGTNTLGICIGGSAMVHLYCAFPMRAAILDRHPAVRALIYVPNALLALGFVATIGQPELRWVSRSLFYAVTFGTVPHFVAAFWRLAVQRREARRTGNAQALAQIRLVLLGTGLGLVVPIALSLLRRALHVWDYPGMVQLSAAPAVFYVLLFAFALVRHNAMEIDQFTSRIVGYAATSAVLGAGLLLLLAGVPLILRLQGMANSPVLLVGSTAIVFLAFNPLQRRIKQRVDRFFFRDQADPARMATVLRDLTLAIAGSDRGRGLSDALKALDLLQVERAELWVLDDAGQTFRRHLSSGGPTPSPDVAMPRSGALGRAMVEKKVGGIEQLCAVVLEPAAAQELWSQGLAMAAPIMVSGALGGFLAVGRQRSGARFANDVLPFFSAVAAQAGLAIERSTQPSSQFGRYRIEKRLGVGGMAEVFLAWQMGPGGFERKVALKKPLPELAEDPHAVEMLLDEARMGASLMHRNIAQIYEVDRAEGSYYIAMEYVDGPSLRQLIRALGRGTSRPPLDIVAGIADGVLSALEHAHHQRDSQQRPLGLVHRDVTPSNILLSLQGDVKLVDFGIARAAHRLMKTRTGEVKGTVPYMSPEQFRGEPLDARSDLYSVGAVLYELLTTTRAFPRGPLDVTTLPIVLLRPDVPPPFAAVIMKALSPSRDDRYASAQEFRSALLAAALPVEPAPGDALMRWLKPLVTALEDRSSENLKTVTSPKAS